MPYKDPAARKQYAREQARPCTDCGVSYPSPVMEFDHGGSDKIDAVSDMVRRCLAWKRIEAEIAKCELVCANCHRLRTFRRVAPGS